MSENIPDDLRAERRFSKCSSCGWIAHNYSLDSIEPTVLAKSLRDNDLRPSGHCQQCRGFTYTIKPGDVTGFAIHTTGEEMGSTLALSRIHWFSATKYASFIAKANAEAADLQEIAEFCVRTIDLWSVTPAHCSLLIHINGEPYEMPPVVIAAALASELTAVARVVMEGRFITGRYPGWPLVIREMK